MKKLILLILMAALIGPLSAASILLSDDFQGSTIDTSKWDVFLPYEDSYAEQVNGYLWTQGRAVVASKEEFDGPIAISGSFTLRSDMEHFNVAFRSDLSVLSDPGLKNTLSGLFVSFCNDGNQVSIQGFGFEGVVASYELETDVSYFFDIYDDGFNVELYINGVKELMAQSLAGTGNHIALYSREYAPTATAITDISVTSMAMEMQQSFRVVNVPDEGLTLGLLVLGLLVMVAYRKNTLIASL